MVGGKSDYIGYRDSISRLANKLCRFLLNIPFDEFTTNFRLYNYKCLKVLNESSLKSDNYSSQIEFLFYIYKAGLKCIEVPISFKDRYKGNSKIPKLQPVTEDEKRRYDRAKERHLKRRKNRSKSIHIGLKKVII